MISQNKTRIARWGPIRFPTWNNKENDDLNATKLITYINERNKYNLGLDSYNRSIFSVLEAIRE